jgi:AraC-like DNA-binding protein
VLLPTGTAHVVASQPAGPARAWDRVAKARARNAAGEIVLPGRGRATHLICAAYDYDRDVVHPLLSLLPPVLVIPSDESGEARGTLAMLHHELTTSSAGSSIIVNRLIDVLLVHVVRAWVARQEDHGRSWLMGLRNPSVARALAIIHAAPAAAWTVDRLARESNLSRASLTRHFTSLVGEPPLAYLTRWRMELAARQLRETDDAIGAIAHRVGYTSEFAFSRAFSRAARARRAAIAPSNSSSGNRHRDHDTQLRDRARETARPVAHPADRAGRRSASHGTRPRDGAGGGYVE